MRGDNDLSPSRGQRLGDDRKILSGRIRPKQKRVEMDLALVPSHGEASFDRGRLGQFPINPVQKLAGAAAPSASDASNYVAAKFEDGVLNLVPIAATLQLRPDFSYIDARNAENERKDGNETVSRSKLPHKTSRIHKTLPSRLVPIHSPPSIP